MPFPSPRDLPDSGVKSVSLVSPALAGRLSTTVPPGKDITEVNTGYCLILLQLLVYFMEKEAADPFPCQSFSCLTPSYSLFSFLNSE